MVPAIVAALLSQGLGLLGNAVLAKGKSVIEEKLGIDIESALQTPEGLQQLKQREIEHEEFLLTRALDETKARLLDVQDARAMNAKVNESELASWLTKNIAALLAIAVVLGGGAMMYFSTEPDLRMAVVSLIATVLSYYFGSSSSSKSKDTVISTLSKGPK